MKLRGYSKGGFITQNTLQSQENCFYHFEIMRIAEFSQFNGANFRMNTYL